MNMRADSKANSGTGEGKKRTKGAYTRSTSRRRFVVWSILLSVLALLLAAGAYFYLNRDHPIVTLNVAAGPYRSDSYELMEQIADVLERQSDFLRSGKLCAVCWHKT